MKIWEDKGNDLLNSILSKMGKNLGYDFDEVHLENESYIPEGHAELEYEQKMMLLGLNQWLYGGTALKIVDANSLPPEEEKASTTDSK